MVKEKLEPHPATVMQRSKRHPATTAQPKLDCGEMRRLPHPAAVRQPKPSPGVVQKKVGFEYEIGDILTRRAGWTSWYGHAKGTVLYKGSGYALTTDEIFVDGQRQTQLEVIIDPIDETSDAEVTHLFDTTVPDLVNNLNQILTAADRKWVSTSKILGWWGASGWDQVMAVNQNISGQLQMTAGLTMQNLVKVLSGDRGDKFVRSPTGVFLNYSAVANREIDVRWTKTWAVVNAHGTIGRLTKPAKQQLTAVVNLLASIPASARQTRLEYPKAASRYLLARTDFATLITRLPQTVRENLDETTLSQLVIDAANSILNANDLDADSPVFPNNFSNAQIPDLTSLTIGAWINALFARRGTYWGTHAAKDLLTQKNFPGSSSQAAWIESMGALSAKMDPGGKPIFEFRGLREVQLENLKVALFETIEYLRGSFHKAWRR